MEKLSCVLDARAACLVSVPVVVFLHFPFGHSHHSCRISGCTVVLEFILVSVGDHDSAAQHLLGYLAAPW